MLRSLVTSLVFLSVATAAWAEDPFDVQLGEKLFQDDRFSRSYFEKFQGKSNQVVSRGEPVLEMIESPLGAVAHPLRGQQMSCAACHLIDQTTSIDSNFVLAYNDFSTRTPVPMRKDGVTKTLRNSMNMVLTGVKEGRPLHWDGEFYSAKDLSCAALQGRNMGWMGSEGPLAKAHVVKILREDSGTYPNDSSIKESYSDSFKALGFDFGALNDSQIFMAACDVMGTFIQSIDYNRDGNGEFIGSAYDRFLQLNGIRRSPLKSETPKQYAAYIHQHLSSRHNWKWVGEEKLQYHQHTLKFGPEELKGLRVFFGRAKCTQCHTPPDFTDYGFHSIGISQLEYEATHGRGSFLNKLKIPSRQERRQNPSQYFVATGAHQDWQGPFAKIPDPSQPEHADLGVWNMLGHPDKPSIQKQLKASLCLDKCQGWSEDDFYQRSIASFKTPTLRSLGQTAPYFHNGKARNIQGVLATYLVVNRMARLGELKHVDSEIHQVKIETSDFAALKAFLESLDEDFD